MSVSPVRVIIADDHPIIADGLGALIRSTPYLTVAAIARSFQELIDRVATVPADVLVLDLNGMGMESSPLSLVVGLTREHPRLGIVVFSSLVDLAPELFAAGVRGYVTKEELSSELLLAIQEVHRGGRFASRMVQDYLDQCARQTTLSAKELSVLKLLAQGLGTAEIASQLRIDARTVQNYLAALRRKTGCDERVELAQWYYRCYGGPLRG